MRDRLGLWRWFSHRCNVSFVKKESTLGDFTYAGLDAMKGAANDSR